LSISGGESTLPIVLVCDDERVLRALARATLEEFCTVVEAEDGERALALAAEIEPDVVIVDMMMPGRSGLEVVAELRRDERLASVPVIMLTARAQAADQEAGMNAGADLFVAKPFSPAELVAAVHDLLERRPRAR
jgi:DNA-binding response OmpR family regulator